MNHKKMMEDTMDNWKFEDAAWDLPNEDREHIEKILREDPVMSMYCTRCAESAIMRFCEALDERSYENMKLTSSICIAGVGLKVLSKMFKK